MSCYQIKISGQVQGVFFRYSAQQEAEKLRLVGYAKNLDDGSVGVVVCGDKEKVKEFINWCHQGPDLAKVEKVDVIERSSQEFKNFQVL